MAKEKEWDVIGLTTEERDNVLLTLKVLSDILSCDWLYVLNKKGAIDWAMLFDPESYKSIKSAKEKILSAKSKEI